MANLYKYKKIQQEQMETILNCSICLENIEEPTTLEKCKHVFCKVCIDAWFETSESCPYCRCNYSKSSDCGSSNGYQSQTAEEIERLYIAYENMQIEYSQENALEITEYNEVSLEGLNFNGFEKITVSNCPNLTTISNLQNLRFLKIANCPNLTTISNLQNINAIRINFCNNLTSIYNIRNSIDIDIAYCHTLVNIFDFTNVNLTCISYCNAFSDASRITNIESRLRIVNCQLIPSSIPRTVYTRSQNNYTYGRNVIYRTT